MSWEIETVFDLSDENLFAEMVTIGLGLFMWEEVLSGEAGYSQYQDNLTSFTVPGGATSLGQVQFDASVDPMPEWEDTKGRFFKYVEVQHLIEFLATDVPRILEELLPGQLTRKFYGTDWASTSMEPANLRPTWTEVKAKGAELITADAVKATVATAYKAMSDNIGLEVYNTFKTTDENSANAFAQSWRIKAERPGEYFNEGLVATDAIGGFLINDLLDTQQKILDFYSAKVDQLITFDKFRDTQIMTYLAAKAAAEA